MHRNVVVKSNEKKLEVFSEIVPQDNTGPFESPVLYIIKYQLGFVMKTFGLDYKVTRILLMEFNHNYTKLIVSTQNQIQ